MTGDRGGEQIARNPDFRRLWAGSAISQFGSAIGGVALPLIALEPLRAGDEAIALIALVGALSLLVVALPAGAWVDVRRKRAIMIGADLARAAALASVPILWQAGHLSVAVLCVVAAINGAANVTFAAASQAHLRDLVTDAEFTDANAKMTSTLWLALIVGPSVSAVLVAAITPVWLCAIDAGSFLIGTLFVKALRRRESAPSARAQGVSERWHLVTGGVRLAWSNRRLRALLLSRTAFAGLSSAFSPVVQVFYLRELGFSNAQYALLMGVPSIGGFLGSWLTRLAAARVGAESVLRRASWARSGLYLLFPLLIGGSVGLALAMTLFGATLFTTSLANSSMTTVRVRATPTTHTARLAALWNFAAMAAGPAFIAIITPLMRAAGPRIALLVLVIGIALTPLLLPSTRDVASG